MSDDRAFEELDYSDGVEDPDALEAAQRAANAAEGPASGAASRESDAGDFVAVYGAGWARDGGSLVRVTAIVGALEEAGIDVVFEPYDPRGAIGFSHPFSLPRDFKVMVPVGRKSAAELVIRDIVSEPADARVEATSNSLPASTITNLPRGWDRGGEQDRPPSALRIVAFAAAIAIIVILVWSLADQRGSVGQLVSRLLRL